MLLKLWKRLQPPRTVVVQRRPVKLGDPIIQKGREYFAQFMPYAKKEIFRKRLDYWGRLGAVIVILAVVAWKIAKLQF